MISRQIGSQAMDDRRCANGEVVLPSTTVECVPRSRPGEFPGGSGSVAPATASVSSAVGTTGTIAWDGVERRRGFAPDVDAIRYRLVSRLEHRRLLWRIGADFAVFLLALLAAFGACWVVALVVSAASVPPEVANAVKAGGLFASGAAATYGAVVSWRVGWRSFFVGWLAGGKLYLAAAVMGLI